MKIERKHTIYAQFSTAHPSFIHNHLKNIHNSKKIIHKCYTHLWIIPIQTPKTQNIHVKKTTVYNALSGATYGQLPFLRCLRPTIIRCPQLYRIAVDNLIGSARIGVPFMWTTVFFQCITPK